MQIPHEVLLCDDIDANQQDQLWAVLDELTLTYSVVFRTHNGSSHALRRHVSSLREARAWASGYQDTRSAPTRPKHPRTPRRMTEKSLPQ